MDRTCCIFALLLVGCMLARSASAQRVETTLYVDVANPDAADQNPTAPDQPFRTVQAAVEEALANKRKGISTRVVISPGVYREAVAFGHTNHPESHPERTASIIVEAAQPGTVVVSGSDVWSGWSRQGGMLVHHWPYDWGAAENPWPGQEVPEIALRREIVFVDRTRMKQVLTAGEMQPGTFRVDEAADKIYLMPPDGASKADADIEVAVREVLWNQSYENHVTLRGVTFEHAATPWREGFGALRVVSSKDVLLEDVTARQNNFAGLFAGLDENLMLRRVILNLNGMNGWSLWKNKNFTAEDTETSYNNWRGRQGGFTFWAPGNKSSSMHGMTLRGHRAVGNYSRGLWLDTDHADVLLEDLELRDNLEDGLFLEANQGPVVVRNSQVVGNGGFAVLVANTEKVTVAGSVLTGNAEGAFHISGADSGRAVTDYETGRHFRAYVKDWTLTGNAIAGHSKAGHSNQLISTTFGADAWHGFTSTLTSDRNTWWLPEHRAAFAWHTGEVLTLEAWQRRTGQDQHSTFARPGALGGRTEK